MDGKPPIYRFGRDTPADPPPNFALWLADRQAKTHALPNRDALCAWLGDAWSAERIAPLIEAIDARSTVDDHAFVAVKPERTADAEPVPDGDLWRIGQTQAVTGSHAVTVLVFQTTHRFLLGDDEPSPR